MQQDYLIKKLILRIDHGYYQSGTALAVVIRVNEYDVHWLITTRLHTDKNITSFVMLPASLQRKISLTIIF